jgi:hypothetical protein
MADDPRNDRAEAIVKIFLQHKSMEQRQDYLMRGRRFAERDVERLNEDWIIAVRQWFARKDRTSEKMLDDLTAELRLRGLEPPYDAVKEEFANRSARFKRAGEEKAEQELAREIGEFVRERRPLH